jgi:F5/8 type C domain/Secretion system C-terminal sorting domain
MKIKITFLVSFLIITINSINCQSSFTAIQKTGVGGSNPTYGFYEYLPDGYLSHPDSAYPLLIYMGGYGEAGNGTTELTRVLNQGCAKLINQGWEFPFLLISPQSTAQRWNEVKLEDFVNQIFDTYRVDSSRVYFTGLSAGATGIWRYAAYYPKKITAIVPIAGRGDEPQVGNCPIAENDIAVWAFHGNADNIVPYTRSLNAVNVMNGINVGSNPGCNPPINPRAKLTVYPGVGHDSWSRTFDGSGMGQEVPEYDPFDMSIYDWMLQYQKKYFAVDAGKDTTITLISDSITLFGSAISGLSPIVSYKWVQLSGDSLAFADTNSFLKLNYLEYGVYSFRLTATDSLNNQEDDEIVLTLLPAPTPCVTPYPKVIGLTSTAVSEGILLEWTPITGSTSCKIKRQLLGGSTNAISVIGNNTSSKLLKTNTLLSGDYKWQIKCSCDPAITGAYSLPAYFSYSAVSSNIALNKPSTQVSTAFSGFPARANDGNTNGVYNSGSVSHTNSSQSSWWQVNLQGSYTISSIVIYNRTDCCKDRLTNYLVEIYDGANLTWSSENHTYPNPSTTLSIPSTSGTLVKISLIGTNILSLAEVEVYGISNGTGMIIQDENLVVISETKNDPKDEYINATENVESFVSENINSIQLTSSKVLIYPNPSSGIFNFNYTSISDGFLKVTVSDIIGKIIFEQSVLVKVGFNKFDLNLANKDLGTYFIDLRNGDNIKREKVLISN